MSKYVYGPVPSRRLGRSLGVDLVPYKTCSYDCIYCQLGKTTCKTIERKQWVPIDAILAELKEAIESKPAYITLAGSGEPTLCSRLDELIEGIKTITDIPIVVLTNGSLLWQDDVRKELAGADLVIPSLDAGDQTRFRYINRPHEDISFDRMLNGLVAFRSQCKGMLWLEVSLLAGYTAIDAEVAKLAKCVDQIKPDRVQLNTATRPPAEHFAEAASPERMAQLAELFNPPAEVIADFRDVAQAKDLSASRQEVLNMLCRRPCSIEDIANGLGMHSNEVVKYVDQLSAEDLVVKSLSGGKIYYKASKQAAMNSHQ